MNIEKERNIIKWNMELLKKLIDNYRNEPILWDMYLKKYRNVDRNVRNAAWDRLAAKMSVERAECERKMNSLLAQYRRERIRLARVRAGVIRDTNRQWFGYPWFDFLARMDAKREIEYRGLTPAHKRVADREEADLNANYADEMDGDDNEQVNEEEDEEASQEDYDQEGWPESGDPFEAVAEIHDGPGFIRLDCLNGQTIIRMEDEKPADNLDDEGYDQPDPALAHVDGGYECQRTPKVKDSDSIFCEHLAAILRAMPEPQRKIAKRNINKILYEGEIGPLKENMEKKPKSTQ